jgi:hypothetical protein
MGLGASCSYNDGATTIAPSRRGARSGRAGVVRGQTGPIDAPCRTQKSGIVFTVRLIAHRPSGLVVHASPATSQFRGATPGLGSRAYRSCYEYILMVVRWRSLAMGGGVRNRVAADNRDSRGEPASARPREALARASRARTRPASPFVPSLTDQPRNPTGAHELLDANVLDEMVAFCPIKSKLNLGENRRIYDEFLRLTLMYNKS